MGLYVTIIMFKLFMAVNVHIAVYWDISPRGLVKWVLTLRRNIH
jgi:hypothetical protein